MFLENSFDLHKRPQFLGTQFPFDLALWNTALLQCQRRSRCPKLMPTVSELKKGHLVILGGFWVRKGQPTDLRRKGDMGGAPTAQTIKGEREIHI